MSKLTIVEGNSNDKDNVRALMVKGEKGEQGDLNHNDIIDNLTSTATDKVLSAKQGKVLKDLIDTNEAEAEDTYASKISLNDEATARATADTNLQENISNEQTGRIIADSNLQNQINGLASGSPLKASSITDMTDTSRIYVLTTDGHWYWYNGSTWIDGGVYQARVEINEMKNQLLLYDGKKITGNTTIDSHGWKKSIENLTLIPNVDYKIVSEATNLNNSCSVSLRRNGSTVVTAGQVSQSETKLEYEFTVNEYLDNVSLEHYSNAETGNITDELFSTNIEDKEFMAYITDNKFNWHNNKTTGLCELKIEDDLFIRTHGNYYTVSASDIINIATNSGKVTVNNNIISGNVIVMYFDLISETLKFENSLNKFPNNAVLLFVHNYLGTTTGLLVNSHIGQNYFETKKVIAYIGNGKKFTWDGQNNTTIKFEDDVYLKGEITASITVNQILSLANASPSVTVNDDNTISGSSFAFVYDLSDSSFKFVGGNINSSVKEYLLLFEHFYTSILGQGLLVDNEVGKNNSLIQDYPLYFKENLENAISSSRNNIIDCELDGDSFVFITDIHWVQNAKNSPDLIKKVIEKLNLDKIICGGDLIGGGTKASMIEEMSDCVNSYKDISRFYTLFGNHDSNHIGAPSASDYFTKGEAYSLMQKQTDFVMEYGNLCYFYFDNKTTKTRYICLDTGLEETTLDTTQSTWITNTLNSMPDGYHALIFAHIIYVPNESWHIGITPEELHRTSFMNNVCTILDTFNSNNNNKKVEAVFGGHVHIDCNFTSVNGIPIVLTDTDGRQTLTETTPGSGIRDNQLGTIKEQCFDITTIDYENRTIKCSRVGRGSNRTINY